MRRRRAVRPRPRRPRLEGLFLEMKNERPESITKCKGEHFQESWRPQDFLGSGKVL